MTVTEEARLLIGEVVGAGLTEQQQRDLDVVFSVLRQKVAAALEKRDARYREVMARISYLEGLLSGAQKIVDRIREAGAKP